MRKHKKNSIFINLVNQHIQHNKKEYKIVILLFLIGIILGVILINQASIIQKEEISGYMNYFIQELKSDTVVDKASLLKETILDYTWITILIWFMGSTVIGIILVYAIVVFKGFCLSYTVSSMIATWGTR